MRALFEDITGYGAAYSSVTIAEVNLPQNSNRRDLWIRFNKAGTGTNIACRVYGTRVDGKAGAVLDRMASVTITPSATPQVVTLANFADVPPDLTGLTIAGTFAAIPDTGYILWGYTAAPDIVTCDNIAAILRTYRGAGMSLEEITDDDLIIVSDEREAYATPAISVRSLPAQATVATDAGSLMGLRIPIEVHVAVHTLQQPGDAWARCRRLHAQLMSILHDEKRLCMGELHVLYMEGVEGPGQVPSKPGLWVGVVRLMAEYTRVFRDDQNPRS